MDCRTRRWESTHRRYALFRPPCILRQSQTLSVNLPCRRGRFWQISSLWGGRYEYKHYAWEVVVATDKGLVNVTNSLRNTQLLRHLPTGFTATATVQVAGRGRGSNVWVSPSGSLIFSTVVRHPMSLMPRAPVVFLQYLAAMAIVDGIRDYGNGYERLPIKLKWPNDICKSLMRTRPLAPAKVECRYPVSRPGTVGNECEMAICVVKISCWVKSASIKIEAGYSRDHYNSLTKHEHGWGWCSISSATSGQRVSVQVSR